jgi:hypothetical protein
MVKGWMLGSDKGHVQCGQNTNIHDEKPIKMKIIDITILQLYRRQKYVAMLLSVTLGAA